MRSLVYAFRHTYGTLAQFAKSYKVIHTVSRTITINGLRARRTSNHPLDCVLSVPLSHSAVSSAVRRNRSKNL